MTRVWERCSGSLRVEDRSALHGVNQRVLWDRLLPRIPARITPNALTLVGHLLGVVRSPSASSPCILAVEGRRWCHVAWPMTIFAALGALIFAVAFWDQYRTGHLSLPKVGPIEGVTALLIWQLTPVRAFLPSEPFPEAR